MTLAMLQKLRQKDITEWRKMFRHWGTYGRTKYGYGFTPFDVDKMDDLEIIIVAEGIARQKPRPALKRKKK